MLYCLFCHHRHAETQAETLLKMYSKSCITDVMSASISVCIQAPADTVLLNEKDNTQYIMFATQTRQKKCWTPYYVLHMVD